MPQPIKDGTVLQYYFGVIKDRPDHAIGIALVASEWAALEEELILLFTYALMPVGPWADGTWSRAPGPAAVAFRAWEAMDSLRPRLDFISRVGRTRLPDDLLKEFTSEVAKEIRSRAGERNRVVHGRWNVSPEYPEDLILVSPDGNLRYTVKDFEDIAKRINVTISMLADFWHRVRERVRSPPP